MAVVKKIKIEDKVDLENIIEYYLKHDLPFSLLEEKYELTYPQRQFLLIKSMGYTRQTEALGDFLPEYGYYDISDDIINIPHNIKEEYPQTHEERMELFKRLDEIKNGSDKHKELSLKLEQLRSELEEYAIYEDDFNNITEYLEELDSLEADGVVISGDKCIELLSKHALSVKKSQELGSIFAKYRELQDKYINCLSELEKTNFDSKSDEYEYDSIREKLVVSNIKLVNWCIRMYFRNMPLPKEDTQALGLEALSIAIDSFDYTKGYHFSTYAVPIIVHHIQRYFSTLMGMEFGEYCKKQNISYWRQELASMDNSRKTPYTAQELADSGMVKYSVSQIKKSDELINGVYNFSDISKYTQEDYSKRYDMPMTFEDYEHVNSVVEEFDVGYDEEVETVFDEAMQSMLVADLKEVLSTLPDRDRQVLIERFGLNGGNAKTLEEVSYKFHVTRERIRQIEARAIRMLRHPSRSRRLMNYENIIYPHRELSVKESDLLVAYRKLYFYRNSTLKDSTKAFFITTRILEWNEVDVSIASKIMDFILEDLNNDELNYNDISKRVYEYVKEEFLLSKWRDFSHIGFSRNGKIVLSFASNIYPFYSIIEVLDKCKRHELERNKENEEKTREH